MKEQKDDALLNITTKSNQTEPPVNEKKQNRFLWSVLFIVIAAVSIWAVTAQNKDFSVNDFLSYVKEASPLWLCAAVASMLAFIIFEASAIIHICKTFGYKSKWRNGFFYSASDIYFSAITPSATGGQPACAYFMIKDGIPGIVVTISLLLNLMMYTISLIVIGIISIIVNPKVIFNFNPLSIILIVAGYIVQLGLALLFCFILYKERFLHRICSTILRILGRAHLIRNVDKKLARLKATMEEYHKYAYMIKGRRKMLMKTLLLNIFQRIAQIAVTMFVFLATGGILGQALDIWSMQNFVVIGAYCIPVPGAVGITDYLMLDGFGKIMEAQQATNLELLSRTLSFYCCILICGISVILKYCLLKRRS